MTRFSLKSDSTTTQPCQPRKFQISKIEHYIQNKSHLCMLGGSGISPAQKLPIGSKLFNNGFYSYTNDRDIFKLKLAYCALINEI